MSENFKNVNIHTMYPPPPCPPCTTDSIKESKRIEDEYNNLIQAWKSGFEDWKERREENRIHNRFEIMDLDNE